MPPGFRYLFTVTVFRKMTMAKKKETEGVADGDDVCTSNAAYADFFEAEMAEASRVMGRDNVLVDDEAHARKYGLEVPSLALQYVLQNDVLFMEHMLLLAGKPKSHKSSFAFEVAKWVINAGGFARLYDTELKYSPSLAENLLGSQNNSRSWQVRSCESLDIWQQMFNMDLQRYRNAFKIKKRLKRGETRSPLLPFCLIVDSLTGRTTQENIDTFDKDGKSSNTSGMRTAKVITDFLQAQNFLYLPLYLVMIRHEKDNSSPASFMAAKVKQTPGGKAPDFIGGVDLRFAVVDNDRSHNSGWNAIRIKCNKNAFGPDRHQCVVRFSWTWTEVDGTPMQIPKWEWDLATAQFVAGFDRAGIKDICHVIQSGTKNNPTFSCKQLSLTDVNGQDMGLAIRQDEKIMTELQNFLHIERRARFNPHMKVPEPAAESARRARRSK